MSDTFQAYVFDVNPMSDADSVARRVVKRLAEAQVILGEKQDNVLGEDSNGYGPGSNAVAFVVDADQTWREFRTNGLGVTVGRVVEANSDFGSVRCPHCAQVISDDSDDWDSVMDAIDRWHEQQDGRLQCVACQAEAGIADWDLMGNMALGNVSLVFWNWPQHLSNLKLMIDEAAGFRSKMVLGQI